MPGAYVSTQLYSGGAATTHTMTAILPGAGTNRIVAIIVQFESSGTVSTLTWGTPSLAGGEIIQAVYVNNTSGTQETTYIYYIREANLPGSATDIVLTLSASRQATMAVITMSGLSQSASPTTGTKRGNEGGSSNAPTAALTAASGSVTVAGLCRDYFASESDTWGGSWTEVQDVDRGTTSHSGAAYSTASGSLTADPSWTTATTNYALAVASFDEATASGLTLTSVNTTNTAFSAQTDSAVVGTGLSASVVCTYAGIACTNESASSSTSLKITFPNFFTNNIKLGRNYEFKVVG
jgi:hypothetical protein